MASESLFSADYTSSYSSLSCYAPMKPVHVAFAYIAVLSGAFCFLSRAIPAIRWAHAWSGRVYILSMLWATATSILISNTGLPHATVISFAFVLSGLTLGWVAITAHQKLFFAQTVQRVKELLRQHAAAGASSDITADSGSRSSKEPPPLEQLFDRARDDVSRASTFLQRLASLKTLHGVLMLVSWVNVAGRAFVTNPADPFSCATYPVYKPIDTPRFAGGAGWNGTLTPVPASDPNYSSAPWASTGLVGWGLIMSLVPLAAGFAIAAAAALFDAWRAKRAGREQPNGLLEQPLQA